MIEASTQAVRESLSARGMVRSTASAAIRMLRALVGVERVLQLLWVSRTHAPLVLRALGARLGAGTRIQPPLVVHNACSDCTNLQTGRDCYIGRDVLIDLRNPVHLGERVTVSMRATLLTHMDVGASPLSEVYPERDEPIRLDDGCYVGAGAIVLPGVRVGECAVVGAGAVVTRDVEPYTVVAGVPARVIKKIDRTAAAPRPHQNPSEEGNG